MDLSNQSAIDNTIFNKKIEEISTLCSAHDSKEMVLHIGDITQKEVNTLSVIVENQLADSGISKSVVKRVFNISIETLQNICFHSEKENNASKLIYFIIGQHEKDIVVYSGNILSKATSEALSKRLKKLQELSESELKQEYLDVLSNGELSKKGGAGLGFLTIALKSNGNVKFDFQPINNDFIQFTMTAKVSG